MRTIDIQFEYAGVCYAATAEFLPSSEATIRVYDFYPGLPDYRQEVYYVYDKKRQQMDFPFFGKKQKGLAEMMFTSISDCCKDSDVLLEMGLGTNRVVKRSNTLFSRLLPAA